MSFVLRKCVGCSTTSDQVGPQGICFDCYASKTSYELMVKEIQEVCGTKDVVREVKPTAPGKPSISLIPREAIFEMARSFDYGTGKHGRYAFRDGVEFSKLIDAALRHLHAVADGEDVDGDSGEAKLLHAGNAMSNLAMLVFMMSHHKDKDDRWKRKI